MLDLAILAATAYEVEIEQMLKMIGHWCAVFGKTDGVCVPGNSFESIASHIDIMPEPASEVARIVHFSLPWADVISIRGSTTPRDWAFNAYVWTSGVLWVLLTEFIPLAGRIEPKSIGGEIREAVFRWAGEVAPEENITMRIKALTRGRNRPVVLTGHSLGGGLANFAAARLGLQAVSFSPVGLTYTAQKIELEEGADPEDLIRMNTVSILPTKDIVPRLEPQGGLVQPINCRLDVVHAIVSCHDIYLALCELAENCLNRPMPNCRK